MILAVIDFLLRTHLGPGAERDFLEGLATGAYALESFSAQDLARCRELLEQYHDADLGLADTVVMATAERLGIWRILTVDERDFRMVRAAGGKSFVLLPADAE